MAESKVKADQPNKDEAPSATTLAPAATPPKNLPLGPETLEAQRKGFQEAEKAAKEGKDVKGEEEDKKAAAAEAAVTPVVPVHPEELKVKKVDKKDK